MGQLSARGNASSDAKSTPDGGWFQPVSRRYRKRNYLIVQGVYALSPGQLPKMTLAVHGVTERPVLVDNVNHPAHYTDGGIECIEAIEAQLTPEEYRGYLKGNVAKYVWREQHKGGIESLRKAQWYLDRLINLE